MTLWVCIECTTKYAVGLFRCPRCHGTDFVEDGQPMPKISKHGGPSDKTLPVPETEAAPAYVAPLLEAESGEALPPVPEEAYGPDAVPLEEGGESPSPGSSSSASTPKPPTTSEPSKPDPQKRTRLGNRSAKGRTESSTAPSRATSGLGTDDLTDGAGS